MVEVLTFDSLCFTVIVILFHFYFYFHFHFYFYFYFYFHKLKMFRNLFIYLFIYNKNGFDDQDRANLRINKYERKKEGKNGQSAFAEGANSREKRFSACASHDHEVAASA